MERGKLFVISAPTGGGKTSLSKAVIEVLKSEYDLKKIITYTTRIPRDDEQNGQDYYFVTRDDFLQKKDSDFFIETTEYNGNLYGSSRKIKNELEDGKSRIIATDRPGVFAYKKEIPEAIIIWITVSSVEDLKIRLMQRDRSEDKKEIEKRIELALEELQEEKEHPIADYTIVNDDFNAAVKDLCKFMKKKMDSWSSQE